MMGASSTTILENQLKDDLNICNWISANNLMLNSKKLQLLIIAPNFNNEELFNYKHFLNFCSGQKYRTYLDLFLNFL